MQCLLCIYTRTVVYTIVCICTLNPGNNINDMFPGVGAERRPEQKGRLRELEIAASTMTY